MARASTRSTRAGPRRRNGPTPGWASTSGRTSRWPTRSRARSSRPASRTASSSTARPTASRPTRPRSSRYTLEYAERETGVPAEAIRELAHAFATAPRAMICWTLGITEHHNAVDNVLALISLVLLDRPRRPVRQRRQPAPWPEQRPGRRRHGRPAGPAARLPARRERRAAREVRRRVGRAGPAEARLAPVGHVRRDGARRPDRGLLHRREPGPVRGRPEAGDRAARGPRLPRGPGPVPDEDRGAGGRRPARPPRPGPRRRARSPTRSGASSACGRPSRRHRARATTSRSSSSSRTGWAPAGARPTRSASGTRSAASRRSMPG